MFIKSRRGRTKRLKSFSRVDWVLAPDIHKRVKMLLTAASIDWVKEEAVYCVRSTTSNARAYARIWGLNRVWQLVLGEKPAYVIEVLAQNFDKLPKRQQDEVLLHELAHIPKNFSGSLMPHFRRGKNKFHDKVHSLVRAYLNSK